ncbi:hypothetical protein F383_01552 [Gossypium arboreum]|uniref:Uncharacterized protein n=1 Tax=Gossypium arboreum TaxID=29729 RepID=A0A0B0PFH0_GOSAR|nr:hypothetical protein F383_01552 [Gossypium arboreum]
MFQAVWPNRRVCDWPCDPSQ